MGKLSGTWVKLLTLDFGSGHDPRVVGSSPVMSPCSAWSLLEILSLPVPLPLLQCAQVVSQQKKKKDRQRKRKEKRTTKEETRMSFGGCGLSDREQGGECPKTYP